MAKQFDPKAKAKRQKIIAGVLGLVLVGVLIFQAPKILGMFGGSSSTASEPAATPAPVPVPVTPVPATPGAPPAAPVPASAGSAALVDSDPAPVPADGQLVTFDRFESKDPFVQQIGDETESGQASAPPRAPAGEPPKADDQKQGGGSASPAPEPTSQPASSTVTTRSANAAAGSPA